MKRRSENISIKVGKSYFFLGVEVSEYSGQTLQKVLLFNENFIFLASKKFSRSHTTTFKVSNVFSQHSSIHWRKNDDHTTRRSENIGIKVGKSYFFRF